MTRPHNDGPAPPSLLLPPIDHLPNVDPADRGQPNQDVLEGFATSVRPWGRLPVPLTASVTCALWIVLVASGGVGGWLIAVLSGAAPCEGLFCTLATLGGHPGLLLALAGSCVVPLLGAATVTRGLTQANAPQLAVIAAAAVAGIVSLLGVAAILLLVTLAMALARSLLVLSADRAS